MISLSRNISFSFARGVTPALCTHLEEFRNTKTAPSLVKRIALEPAYVLLVVAASIELLIKAPLSLISFLALKLFKPEEKSLSYEILIFSAVAAPLTLSFIIKSIQNLYYNLVKEDHLYTNFYLLKSMPRILEFL